jgi:hypothetical protein
MAATPHPAGEGHAAHMARGWRHGAARPRPDRAWHAAGRYPYTSYNVANILLEFSTSIPRTPLRPSYGDGFLGAPLQLKQTLESPAPREEGDQRGSSSTYPPQNSGGAHHV